MKNKNIALAGLGIFIIGALLTLVICITQQKSSLLVLSNTKQQSKSGKENADSINKLDVDSDNTKIVIGQTSGLDIKYEFEGDDTIELKFMREGDKFKIEAKDKRKSFIGLNGVKAGVLTIELPRKEFDEIKVDSDVRSILISDVSVKKMEIDGDVGETVIKNVHVSNKLEVNTDVGELKVNDITGTASIELEGNVGKINAENIIGSKLEVKSDVGSVQLIDAYAKRVKVKTDVGSIDYINSDKDYKFEKFDVYSQVGSRKVEV